jgi:hypothetical protein
MKTAIILCIWMVLSISAGATLPVDVPSNTWAAPSVESVLQRGIMQTIDGRFKGGEKVTIGELAVILDAFRLSLIHGKWKDVTSQPGLKNSDQIAPKTLDVTRYDLAVTLNRFGSWISNGFHYNPLKVYGHSLAIKPQPDLQKLKDDPKIIQALKDLESFRMLSPKSPLLSPPNTPVTVEDAAMVMSDFVTGFVDHYTDEPQNRETTPPSK